MCAFTLSALFMELLSAPESYVTMIVALSRCDSGIVIFTEKHTRLLSALINFIARLIVAWIDSPTLIPIWINPGVGLIRWLCVELIALLFGLSAFSLANVVRSSSATLSDTPRK